MASIYEKMTEMICEEISHHELEVVGIENVIKAVTNKETGKAMEELQAKLELEIPRGSGRLAKTRITVKTPQSGTTRLLLNKDFEEDIVKVRLIGLEISFIDQKRNTYFRCERIEIVKEAV